MNRKRLRMTGMSIDLPPSESHAQPTSGQSSPQATKMQRRIVPSAPMSDMDRAPQGYAGPGDAERVASVGVRSPHVLVPVMEDFRVSGTGDLASLLWLAFQFPHEHDGFDINEAWFRASRYR